MRTERCHSTGPLGCTRDCKVRCSICTSAPCANAYCCAIPCCGFSLALLCNYLRVVAVTPQRLRCALASCRCDCRRECCDGPTPMYGMCSQNGGMYRCFNPKSEDHQPPVVILEQIDEVASGGETGEGTCQCVPMLATIRSRMTVGL